MTTVVSGFREIDGATTAGAQVVVTGHPATGRAGVFRVSTAGVVTRIATGRYRSPMVDRRTGSIFALDCNKGDYKCQSIVRLDHS